MRLFWVMLSVLCLHAADDKIATALYGDARKTNRALGIPANASYITEGRPFYVTNNGEGKAIEGLLA
jgi:hypothetical protein